MHTHYIYTYVYIYIHPCIHTCIHIYTHPCTHTCMHAYITLHYITLHYTTLHYITFHSITLHYITLHCIHTHNIYTHIYIYTCYAAWSTLVTPNIGTYHIGFLAVLWPPASVRCRCVGCIPSIALWPTAAGRLCEGSAYVTFLMG